MRTAREVLITSEASNKVLMRQHQVLISIHPTQKNKAPTETVEAWHPQ